MSFCVLYVTLVDSTLVAKMEAIEGLRYRSNDAFRAVTKVAIREARRKEIHQEIINSEKLKVSPTPTHHYQYHHTHVSLFLFINL